MNDLRLSDGVGKEPADPQPGSHGDGPVESKAGAAKNREVTLGKVTIEEVTIEENAIIEGSFTEAAQGGVVPVESALTASPLSDNALTDRALVRSEAGGAAPQEVPLGRAALGLALYSASAALNTVNTAVRLGGSLGGLFLSPVKRLFNNVESLEPVKGGFEKLVARGESEVDGWIQTGLSQEARAGEAVKTVLDPLVATVVSYLSNHPSVQLLIKNQIELLAKESPEETQINILVRVLADNYITYLNENPEQVKELIRSQADGYIDHLSENPKQVQDLVQGQSVSMVSEITDEVRERIVTGDSLLETLARRLFRRRPRAELPEPPPEVQARARQARLPQDFPRLEAMRDGE